MLLVKKRSESTWEEIADHLGVCRSMVFFYLNENSRISLNHYKKLCVFADIKIKKRRLLEVPNQTKQINELKGLNGELAELLGILAGDGHISTINQDVS